MKKLTLYCSDCNPPKHTGNRQTASGDVATAGYTVSFDKSLYDIHKNKRILLKIYDKTGKKVIASHMPYIQDFHTEGPNIIDFYIGERNKNQCDCRYHEWSGKPCSYEFL